MKTKLIIALVFTSALLNGTEPKSFYPFVSSDSSVLYDLPSSALRLEFVGDLDGDGSDEFVVVVPGVVYSVEIRVFFGSEAQSGRIDAGREGAAPLTIGILQTPWLGGYANLVAGADLNGDGLSDLLLGIGNTEETTSYLNVIFGAPDLRRRGVIELPVEADLRIRAPEDQPALFAKVITLGETPLWWAQAGPLGDFNGDGTADVYFVSEVGPGTTGGVIYGKTQWPEETSLDDLIAAGDAFLIKRDPGSLTFYWPSFLQRPGDINGDGLADLVVLHVPVDFMLRPAYGSSAGATIIFGGTKLGGQVLPVDDLVNNFFQIHDLAVTDIVPDMDGDGCDELLVIDGRPPGMGSEARVFVVYGDRRLEDKEGIDLQDVVAGLGSTATELLFPTDEGKRFDSVGPRNAVACSDIDGDGIPDFAISNPSRFADYSFGSLPHVGQVAVVRGLRGRPVAIGGPAALEAGEAMLLEGAISEEKIGYPYGIRFVKQGGKEILAVLVDPSQRQWPRGWGRTGLYTRLALLPWLPEGPGHELAVESFREGPGYRWGRIIGRGLLSVKTVLFGDVEAEEILPINDTLLGVKIPQGTGLGTVSIEVVQESGARDLLEDAYTYPEMEETPVLQVEKLLGAGAVRLTVPDDTYLLRGGMIAGDMDGDGFGDLIVSFVNKATGDETIHCIRADLLRGETSIDVSARERTKAVIHGPYPLGAPVAADDFDLDGFADVVFARKDRRGGIFVPSYSILFGGKYLAGDTVDVSIEPGEKLLDLTVGQGISGEFLGGVAAASVGDIDGDLYPELLLSWEESTPGNPCLILYGGPALRQAGALDLDGVLAGGFGTLIYGDGGQNQVYSVHPVGDLDHNGQIEIVITGSLGIGRDAVSRIAFLELPAERLEGSYTYTELLEAADVRYEVQGPAYSHGKNSIQTGDLDGDGLRDVVLQTRHFSLGGPAEPPLPLVPRTTILPNWLLTEKLSWAPMDAVPAVPGASEILYEAREGYFLGADPYCRPVIVGDLNGDGRDDLVVKASEYYGGAAYAAIVYGSKMWGEGTIRTLRHLSAPCVMLYSQSGQYQGSITGGACDADLDGLADLVLFFEDLSARLEGYLLWGSASPLWQSAGERFKRGDVNADGKIDLADPISALGYMFGGTDIPCPDAADANDDGRLNIADAVRILTYLFGDGLPLPFPFKSCGEDPTEDELGPCEFPPCQV